MTTWLRTGRVLRDFAASFHRASRERAEWEIEAGRTVFRRRKRFLLLALLPVILYLALPCAGADTLAKQIPVLGGSKAYIPAILTPRMLLGSVLVGLIAGLITGVIGAGGGYILTPALMSFGVRGIMAVGTDQFHLFAKAIMGTTIHRRLGHVNVALAVWFVAGSLGGVTLGGHVSRAIFQHSPAMSDALISAVYVLVLGSLGFYSLAECGRARRADDARAGRPEAEDIPRLARMIQALPLRPRIRFDEGVVPGGRSVSVYPVIACGLVVGFVAAIMGVGGGFLTFPMFVYGLGVSTFTTVGTDILQIVFTTSYSSIFQYAIHGFVFYSVSMGMLVGSLVGVQIGAMVTRMVAGGQIRAFYALTILAGFANRLCALPRKLADLGYLSLNRSAATAIERFGTAIFFAIVGAFALWILLVFGKGVRKMRARERAAVPDVKVGVLVRPGSFVAGAAGLLVFAAVLAWMLTPGRDGRAFLERADAMFNRFAKAGIHYGAEAAAQAKTVGDEEVDFGLRPREFADERKIAVVLNANGVEAAPTGDGRVRVRGRLGNLLSAALRDAEEAHRNEEEVLLARYALPAREVLYCWWIAVDGLARRYVQDGRGAEAGVTSFVAQRVVEPAYNFLGIQAAEIREHAGRVTLWLVFYVAYTLWYGFSILFLFDGLGISTFHFGAEEKRE